MILFGLALVISFTILLTNTPALADVAEPSWSYTTEHYVPSVAISADGEYIAVGSYDDRVYLFDSKSNAPLWSYNTGGEVWSVAISADGEYVVAGSEASNNKIFLFNWQSNTPLWSYTSSQDVLSVAISADGEYIAAGFGGTNHRIYLFHKDSKTPLWSYTTGADVLSVAISADGEYIAAGSYDNKVYLFDKDNNKPLWNYTAGENIWSVAISANGEYIAAGSEDKKVYFFDKYNSSPLWNYTTGNTVFSVDISANGQYIAAGSNDNNVYFFDRYNSTPNWNHTMSDAVWTVAISADGQYIAAGSYNDMAYLFDKDSNTPLWNYTTLNYVRSVAISADGENIVTSSEDRVYHFDDQDYDDYWGIADDVPNDSAASLDSDGDGFPDEWNTGKSNTDSTTGIKRLDDIPNDSAASLDSDGDGFPDEWNMGKSVTDSTTGLRLDAFPEDTAGSLDSDSDGFPDKWNVGKSITDSITGLRLDAFPEDAAGSLDSDGDGYPDNWNTNKSQIDSTTGLILDPYPADFDNDGTNDLKDAFFNNPAVSLDSDGDGYPDGWNQGKSAVDSTISLRLDDFPKDFAASLDSDGDGYPDEWNTGKSQFDSTTSLRLDVFPLDSKEWIDSDGDGVGDNGDAFPSISWLHAWWQMMAIFISSIGIGLAVVVTHRSILSYSLDRTVKSLSDHIETINKAGWPHELDQRYMAHVIETKGNRSKSKKSLLHLAKDGIFTALQVERTGMAIDEARQVVDHARKAGFELDTSALDRAKEAFKAFDYDAAQANARDTRVSADMARETGAAIDVANQTIDRARKAGIVFDTPVLDRAVKEFKAYDYEAAKASAGLAQRAVEGLMEIKQQVLVDLPTFRERLDEAAGALDTSSLIELSGSTETALEAGNPKTAKQHLSAAVARLEEALAEWEPVLVVTLPTELSAGVWERTTLSVRNDGCAHARNIHIEIEGLESKGIPGIDLLRAGDECQVEVALRSEGGTVPLKVALKAIRPNDGQDFSFEQSEWLTVRGGGSRATPGVAAPQAPSAGEMITLLRETENIRGYIRVKVAATNVSDAVVTDAGLELIYDGKVLRFERIEPDYRMDGSKVLLSNLSAKERKTVSLYLDPQICTATYLDGTLTFKDTQGGIHVVKMHRKQINVVCPIFFTKETANPAMLRNLVANILPYSDAKLYTLPKGLGPKEAFTVARENIAGRDVQFVRELSETVPYVGEAWYYGITKVKKLQMAIRVSVREETHSIEIFGAAPNPEMLTGLLAELGHDLQERLEKQGLPAQQITNITIKDSIINRSTLLFSEDEKGDIQIEDSVVNRSTIEADSVEDSQQE